MSIQAFVRKSVGEWVSVGENENKKIQCTVVKGEESLVLDLRREIWKNTYGNNQQTLEAKVHGFNFLSINRS